MSDLVKRLRDHCFSTDWQVAVADAREAANCIERMEMLLEAGGARYWENRCLELEAVLREIADTHIPDQPAAAYGDGEYWARQQHTELRRIALAALGEKKDD